ncbi:hypothetical protein Ccrd_014781 [Cynara cardunculus var. scolymus]|uniref:Uncharacterized protein n=1 Tax=Cynara cardunculus var. scolymus TaxID=59895 RepID=A0A103YD23_CYNCS|nr:hypothetical protein Ccrd_014781 [Cynara cardunculus var. scolymus]
MLILVIRSIQGHNHFVQPTQKS